MSVYERKTAEKRTPRKERPEIAIMVDSLPDVLFESPLDVEEAPALVPVLEEETPPEDFPVAVDDAEEEEAEAVGRPVKTAALVRLWQLEEEGIFGS